MEMLIVYMKMTFVQEKKNDTLLGGEKNCCILNQDYYNYNQKPCMMCNFCSALYILLCTFCFLLTVENVFCTLVFSVFSPHTRKHFPENFFDRKQTEHKKQEVPNRPSTQRPFGLNIAEFSSVIRNGILCTRTNLQSPKTLRSHRVKQQQGLFFLHPNFQASQFFTSGFQYKCSKWFN